MKIEFNSHENFYKEPFGAVAAGTPVKLRLTISGIGIPWEVKVIYKYDNEETEICTEMSYVFSISDMSIYSAAITPEKPGLVWYYFKIVHEKGTAYYGNNSDCFGGIGKISEESPKTLYQLTVYDKEYKTPEWFREGIAYQIFPDRFCNGNENGEFRGTRDDIIKRSWGDMPFYKAEQFGGEYLANDFFGGNLEGIIKKLPYLKELGISIIYLNPIFEAYSNHKYDTGNYKKIDPMFGDEDTFKHLCTEAKKLGIRIILDGVFNHTGSNSRYFNKDHKYDSIGAYQSKESPYYDWYSFSEYPDKYDCWWGMTTLPHTNENSKSFREYLLTSDNSVVKKWLKLGASGWRLDVVDELPGFFVKELRCAVKSVDENAVIIGEVWEDASNKSSYGERREYFQGFELDSVMNYPLRDILINAVLGKIDAETIHNRIMSIKENYPKQAFYSLLNMLSSHDVERILTMMGNVPSRHETTKDFQASYKLTDNYDIAVKRLKQITGLQLTLPGVPCIYYGDELGTEGYADPFCRTCMDFSKATDDNNIYSEFKKLISLRNSSKALSIGEFETVYKIGNVYGYLRSYNDERYVIISNFSDDFERIRLDLGRFNVPRFTDISNNQAFESKTGIYFADIPAHENKIYKI